MPSVVIDFHTHVVPPRIKEGRAEYIDRDPCFSLLYAEPKARLVTAEELIASMDEDEIDLSVILNLGWVSHQLCVETNDYILESACRYPNRLIGFCAIQPQAGDAAVMEIERCARSGAKGIGEMRPDIQGFDLRNEAVMKQVVAAAVKHNLIFLTHTSEPVGHHYFGKGNVTPEFLYPFILSFPDLKVVCAHWGGGLPFYALMPEVAAALTNVFFDTAATPFLYRSRIFNQVIDLVGVGKILFGSDYPLLSQRRVANEIQSLDIGKEAKSKILGDNACGLLSLED